MHEEIIIRCYNCGFEIGRIAHIPGHQKVGCPKCQAKTDVEINEQGHLYTH